MFSSLRLVKKLPISRNNILFLCAFFYSFSINILSFTLLYLLTDKFGFSAGQVGASLALGTGIYFLGCTIYQRFGNKGKPKYILPAAVFCSFISTFILALTTSGSAAVITWGFIQGATGFFWPPLMAWFTQGLDETELNHDISWYNRAWMSALLIGPLVGGALYRVSTALVFALVCLCLFSIVAVLVFLAFFTEPGRKDNTTGQQDEAKTAKKNPLIPERLEKSIQSYKIRGWIGGVCSNLFSGVLGNVVPLYIRDTLGYTEKTAGLVMLFRGIAGVLAFTFFAKFIFWHFNKKWILFLHGSLIVSSLILLFSGKMILLYMIIAFAFGFISAGCYNNSIFHSGVDKKNPAKNMALHEIFLSIGGAAGSLGGGYCLQFFGMGSTFFILAIIQGAGLAAQFYLDRRQA
ncbi:MFS transporter [Leadbettera azotonutricia]|uniref:Transporter, major facilitator family n=1 Tax=Leadbettera azotonutricia (strain ATCC BAA-888 / DSM 13862 / ZAS-9) TaxID=545695 RepID=F5YDT5_LEAAZ|nr:MFS transporter [Leadbettera azotonutricia]AEF81139.1 transporter, major facilitator family [Leadbettera azotonutricia ZAS-9]